MPRAHVRPAPSKTVQNALPVVPVPSACLATMFSPPLASVKSAPPTAGLATIPSSMNVPLVDKCSTFRALSVSPVPPDVWNVTQLAALSVLTATPSISSTLSVYRTATICVRNAQTLTRVYVLPAMEVTP